MGKKDVHGIAPVENYRKSIGKQDYKRSKKDIKAAKKAAQQRQSGASKSRIYEGILVLAALCAVLCFVYFIFAMNIRPVEDSTNKCLLQLNNNNSDLGTIVPCSDVP
ncbi:triple QxxK/R motif-containing protein-like [Antedon mediterranea]|uniref:triple QxxK/R motif-containing protein-like n=1 Tax=Antedon mediterranea TaxID=105859 RepID=UPI003AF89ECA